MLRIKVKFIIPILIFFLLLSISYNKFVLPVVIDVTQKYAVTAVNKEINNVYNNIITQNQLNQSSFTESFNSEAMQYVNTNTVVVNKICGEMADVVSERLNNIKDNKVKVPLALFTNSNILSGIGPDISISINSMGQAKVDYDSSFKSCGVNQVNYQLWLNVETEVSVITPVVHKNVNVKRKIMIIDMVYSGGVPNGYVNINR
jgi:sporulation protein yunB